MTVVHKDKIFLKNWYLLFTGHCHGLLVWLQVALVWLSLKVRVNWSLKFPLWLSGDLNFDRELFIIGGWCHTTVKYQVALISWFVVDDVNSWLFGIKNNLRIFLKTDLLRIIFVQIKLKTLHFLTGGWRLMRRIRFFLLIENFSMTISF